MRTSFFIVIAFLTISCSTPKNQSSAYQKFTEISFGSGGGFTGAMNSYLLKSSREVYKSNQGDYLEINKISKSDMRELSDIIKEIDFYELNFSEVGNMTYFIEVKTNENLHKVTWTDNSQADALKNFYKVLVKTLKQN